MTKDVVKSAIAHALYYAGVLHLWKAFAFRRRAVVLMYHRVLTDAEWQQCGSHPGIVVRRETFERQMAMLKRNFTVLSVGEFHDFLKGNRGFPPSSCLITFDDGWRDNYVNALPVLQRLQLPALVFLPINFIGTRRLFWREALTQLVTRAAVAAGSKAGLPNGVAEMLELLGMADVLNRAHDDPRRAVISMVTDRMKAGVPVAETALAALQRALGVAAEDLADADAFMTWDEVRAMAGSGISIGGHGVEHRLLTAIPAVEAQREVRGSMQALASFFETAIPTFSYPNGNWNPAIAAEVRQAGFQMAFTTEDGNVGLDDNPWALRRVNVHEGAMSSPAMFLAGILGLF